MNGTNLSRANLLQGRQRALQALAIPEMPDDLKMLYKRALDHAETALGMQDAMQRISPDPAAQIPS